MSQEIYLKGKAFGEKHVRKYLTAIYAANDVADLGRIAGAALACLAEPGGFVEGHDLARTHSWREGFFDGFVDKAMTFWKKP